jgi:GAF domain-containing protein
VSLDDVAFERALGPLLELVGRSTRVSHTDLLARLEEVVDAATVVLRVHSVGLILLDEDDRLRVAAATDDSAAALEAAQARHGVGPGIDCMRSGTNIAVADLWAADGYASLRPELGGTAMRAVLSSPIRVDGSVAGNFNALHPEPHEWTAAQIRANAAYADVVGLALRSSAYAASAGETVNRLEDQVSLSAGPTEIGARG